MHMDTRNVLRCPAEFQPVHARMQSEILAWSLGRCKRSSAFAKMAMTVHGHTETNVTRSNAHACTLHKSTHFSLCFSYTRKKRSHLSDPSNQPLQCHHLPSCRIANKGRPPELHVMDNDMFNPILCRACLHLS